MTDKTLVERLRTIHKQFIGDPMPVDYTSIYLEAAALIEQLTARVDKAANEIADLKVGLKSRAHRIGNMRRKDAKRHEQITALTAERDRYHRDYDTMLERWKDEQAKRLALEEIASQWLDDFSGLAPAELVDRTRAALGGDLIGYCPHPGCVLNDGHAGEHWVFTSCLACGRTERGVA